MTTTIRTELPPCDVFPMGRVHETKARCCALCGLPESLEASEGDDSDESFLGGASDPCSDGQLLVCQRKTCRPSW